jgi:hypothetical protein
MTRTDDMSKSSRRNPSQCNSSQCNSSQCNSSRRNSSQRKSSQRKSSRRNSSRRTLAHAAARFALVLLATALLPRFAHSAVLNLATLSCATYENEVLASTLPGYTTDPIDTVMWLFGFSVAKSGQRFMYGDSLTAFGFALDTECKNNPTSTLLQAVSTVQSKRQNPMDLTRLDCATFATRHQSLAKSDPESAKTLTMWLFGYAIALSGSHVLDAESLPKFDDSLNDRCAKHPDDSVYDALNAPNPAVPGSVDARPGGRRPAAAH